MVREQVTKEEEQEAMALSTVQVSRLEELLEEERAGRDTPLDAFYVEELEVKLEASRMREEQVGYRWHGWLANGYGFCFRWSHS